MGRVWSGLVCWAVAVGGLALVAKGSDSSVSRLDQQIQDGNSSSIHFSIDMPHFMDAAPSATTTAESQDTRVGLFGLLDSRSKYNKNWFPETFLKDEMAADQEVRLQWFHAESPGVISNQLKAEIEKSFGLLTLEVGVPWEQTVDHGDRTSGLGNIELAARHPIFQYVSPSSFFDYTLGARLEVGMPTNSAVSKNAEIVGGLYQTIGLGDHFSVQTSAGYSALLGPAPDGGSHTLEYPAVVGYNVEHDQLPLPAVWRTVPIFELDGETGLNMGNSGHNQMTGTVGVYLNFDAISLGQPKVGFGYVFPIDRNARDNMKWGTVLTVLIEY